MEQSDLIFIHAAKGDVREIQKLYRDATGTEGCTWNEDYPNEEITAGDIRRNALFCLKTKTGEVVGAVSIDEDKAVEELACWSKEAQPSAEAARLVVKEAYRNQSLARRLLIELMKELRAQGYKSIHFLVSKHNEQALRSYAHLCFKRVGESNLFGENWWCYEQKL